MAKDDTTATDGACETCGHPLDIHFSVRCCWRGCECGRAELQKIRDSVADAERKELARQIAALEWQPRPGMACRDPESGRQWRRLIDKHLTVPCSEMVPMLWAHPFADTDALSIKEAIASIRRAYADGPDLDDLVTAVGLLADVPPEDWPFMAWHANTGRQRWSAKWGFADDCAEACARTWIAWRTATEAEPAGGPPAVRPQAPAPAADSTAGDTRPMPVGARAAANVVIHEIRNKCHLPKALAEAGKIDPAYAATVADGMTTLLRAADDLSRALNKAS